ncbi:P-loop containing nucleoside triphosphate hydrolase protein [Pholiota molesta]|nr:P-loop containing nucleoside triphosphate hydrolase protein [Pholiota molesta]
MAVTPPPDKFKFSSPEGIDFCRGILIKTLPFCPHDYQLAGVASILDGHDFLAVSATGSGKTAYTYMTLHVIQAIQKDPSCCPSANFPHNAAILVISPTTALEEDQATVNSITKQEADKKELNIWKQVEAETDVVLVSPEMLSTPGFQYLVDSKLFCGRLYAICFDELHLLNSWGVNFRPDFQQIAFVRRRFIQHVILFGTTATLRIGLPMQTILKFLGFNEGRFVLHRRSNARSDIKLTVRTLDASHSSERFPQLDWILKAKGKTLVFCPTIRFGFKLAVYFWHLDPRGSVLDQNIRLFNSLNAADYNRETLQLLEGNNSSNITIATDKLSVGVDIADFQTVVIIDPKNMDDMWQKAGRVGRDRSKISNPQVVVYFPREVVKAAEYFAEAGNAEDIKEDQVSLYRFITAPCKPAEIDVQYGNGDDEPCSPSCLTCAASPPPTMPSDGCICSGCQPEPRPAAVPKASRAKQLPVHLRVTKAMRQLGVQSLQDFREEVYFSADELSTSMVPLHSFLPDNTINSILDNFPTLLQKSTIQPFVQPDIQDSHDAARRLLTPFIKDNQFMVDRSHDLLRILWNIHILFDRIREEKKQEQKAKRDLKRTGPQRRRDNTMEIGEQEERESEHE